MPRLNPMHRLVSSRWISDTRRESLALLFRPYRRFFRGWLDLDRQDLHPHDWKWNAHQALCFSTEPLPGTLAVALAEIIELSDPEAQSAFLDLAAERRIQLGSHPQLQGPSDLAILFRVHHPALFFRVYLQQRHRAGEACGAFDEPTAEGPGPKLTRHRLLLFLDAIAPRRAPGGAMVEPTFRYFEGQGGVDFYLSRFPPSRAPIFHDHRPRVRTHGERVSYRSSERCLEVVSWSREDVGLLATAFGEAFHGNREHYRRAIPTRPRSVRHELEPVLRPLARHG